MSHDELLKKLLVTDKTNMEMEVIKWQLALYAVVELHKPFDYELAPDVYKLVCTNCQMGAVEQYPCQTIQKIMDELK